MLDEIIVLLLIAGLGFWLASSAFRKPDGVYVKSLVATVAAAAGGYGIGFVIAPFLGSGAGFGVFLLYCAFMGLVAFAAILASAAATARRLWDLLRPPSPN